VISDLPDELYPRVFKQRLNLSFVLSSVNFIDLCCDPQRQACATSDRDSSIWPWEGILAFRIEAQRLFTARLQVGVGLRVGAREQRDLVPLAN
jgi:hypothetical protein